MQENQIQVHSMRNESMSIYDFENIVKIAKSKGATHIKYWWSGDPRYPL